jgi:hypothetical protein
MSIEKPRTRATKRMCIESEEARAWVGFYRGVGSDPAIATEVLLQLDADPEMKRAHLALYLCCKQSLRTHHARHARNQRVGRFVRWLSNNLILVPARALRSAFRQGGEMAIECLPDAAAEPALSQVQRLNQEPEFARMQTSFESQGATSSASTPSTRARTKASPKTKAASQAA